MASSEEVLLLWLDTGTFWTARVGATEEIIT